MITCASPRCCECGRPLRVVEPFTDGVCQHQRCDGCGVHLHIRRVTGGWTVCTAAFAKGQRTAPLPAIAPAALRAQFRGACRRVAQLLQRDGVEPGESSLQDEAA